jgi:hypothetical protein
LTGEPPHPKRVIHKRRTPPYLKFICFPHYVDRCRLLSVHHFIITDFSK